jgi:hypothetical protein
MPSAEEFGYYADPVDETTAILPKGWAGRLANMPQGDTDGVRGLCLEPHDLVISKYAAGREKDKMFTRELAVRHLVDKDRLLALLEETNVDASTKERIRAAIERDFGGPPAL